MFGHDNLFYLNAILYMQVRQNFKYKDKYRNKEVNNLKWIKKCFIYKVLTLYYLYLYLLMHFFMASEVHSTNLNHALPQGILPILTIIPLSYLPTTAIILPAILTFHELKILFTISLNITISKL